MQFKPLALAASLASAAILTIAACGGGGGSSASTSSSLSISGTAATGAAIAGGTVSVKCTSGSGTATTNTDGSYTVSINGGTAPCLLKVTATDAKGVTTDLYSGVEPGQTTANVTPLTQLVIANALGTDPSTVFSAGLSTTDAANLSSTALSTAASKVQTVLTSYGIDLTGVDPLKATLTAATENASGNTLDQKIDGLMSALKSAGVTLTTVTNVVKDNTKTASTLTSDLATAAPNLSSSGLDSCPVARSGSYFYAAPGDTTLNKVTINFSASGSSQTIDGQTLAPLQGWDVANAGNFTVTPVNGKPCAYAFTLSGGVPIHVRVSASGVAAFGLNGTATVTNASTAVGSNVNAGLILPAQRSWTRANLVGTMYGLHYSKATSDGGGFGTNAGGIFMNFYSKYKVENNGTTAKVWVCPTLATCPAETVTPNGTFSISNADSDGIFTFTSTSGGSDVKLTVFQAANGDTVAMGVNTSAEASGLVNNFFVMSDRVNGFPGRTVNQTWSNTNWQLKYSGGSRVLETNTNDFVATTVDTVAKYFTRRITDNLSNVKNDKITWNAPLNGMITRTESDAGAHNFIGFTGTGWTVFVSDAPGGGSDTAGTLKSNNFMGFSINPI